MNPTKKLRNQQKETEAEIILVPFTENNRVNMEWVADYQIRLTRDKLKIDIYPHSNKYHIIKGRHSREYRSKYNNLLHFVSDFFAE